MLNNFSLKTIRGRYLVTAIIFITYLIIMALTSTSLVENATQRSIDANKQQAQLKQQMQVVISNIARLNLLLQRYLISPSEDVDTSIDATVSDIQQSIAGLLELPWIQKSSKLVPAIKNIKLLSHQLQLKIDRLLEIRSSPLLLYPASKILQESMLPANLRFMVAVNLAINETDGLPNSKQQMSITDTFRSIRLDWTRMIGAFRVYIAGRFGIFPAQSNTPEGAQIYNIKIYIDNIEESLKKLKNKENELEFQQSLSLEQMEHDFKAWRDGLDQAVDLYNANNWRRDIPFINQTINPIFTQIWSNINVLEEEISRSNRTTIREFTETSTLLSQFFWLVAAIGISLTLLGLVLFNKMIHKPLAYVSSALYAQAKGSPIPAKIKGTTAETRYLLSAFEHMQQEVNTRQQRLAAILDYAGEGIFTIDMKGEIESANKSMEDLFGFKEEELIGKPVTYIVPDFYQFFGTQDDFIDNAKLGAEQELTGVCKKGKSIAIAITLSQFTLDNEHFFIGLVSDIRERKSLIEHLQFIAEHDELTELKNRGYFQRYLDNAVYKAQNENALYGLLYIDLDNFKYINDTLSHAAGDQLLQEVVDLLMTHLPDNALLARFGGDEFTALFQIQNADQAVAEAEHIRSSLNTKSFLPMGKQIHLSCSIGVLIVDSSIEDSRSALSKVDLACHLAKRSGRNRVHLYQRENQLDMSSMETDMSWTREIRHALQHDRFVLAFQPILNTAKREVVAYEVLTRMVDEKGQLLMPGGFFPVAERYGLAAEIDRWIIRRAFASLAEFNATQAPCRFSINLSGQTLGDLALVDFIKTHIDQYDINPSLITFEITETIAIENMNAARILLRRIQELGCLTALDDFGVGMSSFAYLQDLPVDYVKIDGRFVKNIDESDVSRAMVRAMHEVAHALGKQTVAEFVQNEAGYRELAAIGVDYCQGYYFGKPVLFEELINKSLAWAGQ